MSGQVKIIAFANDPNEPMLINFIRSLKKFGYDYAIIGNGIKWENFMTKIRECLKYIKTLNPHQLVAIVDAYDVMATGPSDEFIAKYKSYGKPLVVGSETYCGSNCIPLDSFWITDKRPNLQYANGGFYVGPAWKVSQLFNFMLTLGTGDDQEALCTYINNYSEEVALDTKAKLVGNITQFDFGHLDFHAEKGRIYHKLTNEYPLFIHTPGKTGDLMVRTNYVGTHVLGKDYQLTPYSVTATEIYRKIPMFFRKNYKILIPIILMLVLIIGVLAYYSPKLLALFLLLIVIAVISLIFFYSQGFEYI